MRYRTEVVDGYSMVHNVETDAFVAVVFRPAVPDPAGRGWQASDGCEVFTPAMKLIAFLPDRNDEFGNYSASCQALFTAARAEEQSGYPHLKLIKGTPDPKRIEDKLATLTADAACLLARVLIDYRTGSPNAEAKAKLAERITELVVIAWPSRFGSYDAERNVWEAYFRNAPPSDPRMNFSEATLHWGGFYLHQRCPDVDETLLTRLLSSVVELVQELIYRMMEPDPSSLH